MSNAERRRWDVLRIGLGVSFAKIIMDALHGKQWTVGGIALFVSAPVLFVVDRALKIGVTDAVLGHGDAPIRFALFKNSGIAFSLPLASAIFWPAAIAIFAFIFWSFLKSLKNDRVAAGFFLLILLGALSNLIDRALYGATLDYLIFFGRSAVNVADGMIVVGLLSFIFRRPKADDTPTS